MSSPSSPPARFRPLPALVGLAGALALIPSVADASYVYEQRWEVAPGARAIAASPAGIYVSSGRFAGTGSRIARYTAGGRLTRTIDDSGDADGLGARGLATGPDGRLWATEGPSTIRVLSADGVEVERKVVTDTCGGGNGVFINDIDVDPSGALYRAFVDDCTAGTPIGGPVQFVTRVLPDGREASAWGGLAGSTKDGEFGGGELSIASDGRGGSVYVSDGRNERVQQFTADGRFVRKWGQAGRGRGQFSSIDGIEVGPAGDVFVAEHGNDRVQRFSADGRVREQIVTPSDVDDATTPIDVALDAKGRLYVLGTRTAGAEVHVFVPTDAVVPAQTLRYRGKRIAIKLRCTAKTTCRGTVGVRKGKTKLGSRSYRVAAGKTASVVLAPSSRAARRIRGKQDVTVTVSPRGGVASTRTLRLRG
ncbi:NHL repeat-containing protein [Patulibacter defluvii]|uniref:NHL repeat-containing protein n=1 Tax=Patulibacter defluvii TaxID=3095358 RepID=UPI002A749E13|nr:NHL repeat-containing protein [Patulibacter sp. DM4]